MKKALTAACTSAMLISILTSCVDKSAKERVEDQRKNWETELADSVKSLTRQVDSVKNRLEELHSATGTLLSGFRCVENPREVEKYYLPQVSGYTYPLTGTGLASRVMANEQLELVAVLTGPRFSKISIQGNNGSIATTQPVPADQALNYRSGNTTTVSFSGSVVDSLASVLSELTPPIKVTYYEGTTKVGETALSLPQTQALEKAAQLAWNRRETLLTEKRLNILSRKLAMLKSRNE